MLYGHIEHGFQTFDISCMCNFSRFSYKFMRFYVQRSSWKLKTSALLLMCISYIFVPGKLNENRFQWKKSSQKFEKLRLCWANARKFVCAAQFVVWNSSSLWFCNSNELKFRMHLTNCHQRTVLNERMNEWMGDVKKCRKY